MNHSRRFSLKLCAAASVLVAMAMPSLAQNKDAALQQKISALVKKMTLEEKIGMLHANAIFTTAGVPRLGIPGLTTDDGPLGVREDLAPGGGWAPAHLTTDSATFFPNGSALAATWNPQLANRFGAAMGEEARYRKKYIMLAPAFNICRTPLNGRTYEYYSEDPFLNSRLAVEAVKGLQSKHIAACVKHYAVNNQETDRDYVNVTVSERALREIYLPAFKASIEEGHAMTIMSAYNKLRGVYCSENAYLLQTLLRDEWKFKGIVISDWGGTHSTVNAANNGLDVEMGTNPPYENNFFGNPLLNAVKSGQVSEQTIDDKVSRILWVQYQTAMYPGVKGYINTAAHSKLVYDVAAESIVLLKNEKQLLPLKPGSIKSIAVIGDNATHHFQAEGFGAGVKARYEVTALEGLKKLYGKTTSIQFAQGYRPKLFNDIMKSHLDISEPDEALVSEAVSKAKACDVAILFVGGNRDYESESRDRKDLSLPFGEQALIDAVTAANPKTIVVVIGGAPYDLNEVKEKNHTIVFSWFNGSESGNALADMLAGKINPSGKLPFTFPAKLEESPAHALKTFPGVYREANYKEGILVGYRWFDTKNIKPLYPFGYGLSYTSFGYGALKTNKKSYGKNETIVATIPVKNIGKISGRETVQLYVGKAQSKVERATKELKAFSKVPVAAGAVATVTLRIPVKDLAYYDEQTNSWVVEEGVYQLMAGSSSQDIRGKVEVEVRE